jgi:hypothetical protein
MKEMTLYRTKGFGKMVTERWVVSPPRPSFYRCDKRTEALVSSYVPIVLFSAHIGAESL